MTQLAAINCWASTRCRTSQTRRQRAGKAVIAPIRTEERSTRRLPSQGMKKHADATLVAINIWAANGEPAGYVTFGRPVVTA